MLFFSDHGRSIFRKRFGHKYVSANADDPSSLSRDPHYFVWVPPRKWNYVPDFRGRSVAIIGNREVLGAGLHIDSYDEIIRINRMGYWRQNRDDDGSRVTCWAGLARANIIPDENDLRAPAVDAPSCFPEIVDHLSLIWAVTPFHVSFRFMEFLKRRELLDKLYISGGAIFFRKYLKENVPHDLYELLYRRNTTSGVDRRFTNFDLLLTGVRIALLTVLSQPAGVGLFGFDFYEGSIRRPWEGHDLDMNRRVLSAALNIAREKGIPVEGYTTNG